jgi:spore coat assembly protein
MLKYDFKIGDVVSRKSYGCDVFFKIIDLSDDSQNTPVALLKGLELRVLADAPLDDLQKVGNQEVRDYRKRYILQSHECIERIVYRRNAHFESLRSRYGIEKASERDFFSMPGRVLHIDGDQEYLEICMNTYKQLDMNAIGEYVPEEEQPDKVLELLKKNCPDILILTGHDGLLNKLKIFRQVSNYRNSRYFIEAVKKARQFEKSLDELVIFAGACQSYYEAILAAGANFASSPHRVMIHCLDPVFIMEKVAYFPINQVVNIKDAITATITGIKGIGGLETRGKLREGLPRSPYD